VRWPEFLDRLSHALTDGLPSSGSSRCGGDHHHAEQIMEQMGGIDVDATLEVLFELGGGCDCECLMNIVPDPDDPVTAGVA
jgi:uncharacterized protein DUF2695